ncbi:hydantoinase B/oxoprolinase family protein [Paraburkholderia phenazinium]|uniref:N-methylhydantoinase B n=1 Tax=Paraburkholderia phenazinium TaxID=60549 RepID=A0A1N6J0R0_9BURK|nr:hydantoinase B/oxoprolinase family protein [Paraburkholderia phenazinium]SIO37821.1 N-methylhydantoinase B [Paraburkholderia phenazinium]
MNHAMTDLRQQLMWTRLISVVEESAQALMRTAFSTTVRDAGDLSAAIFDTRGRMIAEAVTGTPGHVNSMAEGVRHFLARFPIDAMEDGDHFVTNDPWLTAGHLHDITVISPVVAHGKVVAMIGCCCHQVDIGGLGQGPDGRSIFEEGLQIPLLKLASRGVLNQDLMSILRANVRTPLQAEGDMLSYIACNQSGAVRLRSMLNEYGLQDFDALADYIIDQSLAATRDAIAKLPRGSWSADMTIDGYDAPITLRARLTIAADTISVDYAGSADAVSQGINVVLNYCRAYSIFGLKCVVAPQVPNNHGALAPFIVDAPAGSILNAQRPSPVAARHVIGQMLPDLVFGCLGQALPERTPAEGSSCLWSVQLRGVDAAGGTTFDTVFFNSGGSGARAVQDGLSATAFPSGVRAMPVEVTEAGAPIVIWRKELRADSGGAGRTQGGLGQVVEVGTRDGESFEVLAMFERVRSAARGRAGGLDGATGTVHLASGTALRAKGLQRIPRGDRLVLALPGGAGLGDPAERPAERIEADLAHGRISAAFARDAYPHVG